MKVSQVVIVTDLGKVVVTDRTLQKYEEWFFRKRAPKKSKKQAIAALEAHVMAMSAHAWIMGDVLTKV